MSQPVQAYNETIAVKFTDKKVPGLHLDLDEDFQAAGCFMEIIRGYKMGVVEPDVMRGLQPAGATRVTLDVIIPSPTGLTPEKWKQTATLCPLDWPSNYSLLLFWHMTKDLVALPVAISHKVSLKPKLCAPATLIQKTSKST